MPDLFVNRSATRFTLQGNVFPVSGVNCYFLAYCSDASRQALFQTAQQMGANTIRAWAFADAATPDNAPLFQYRDNGVVQINHGPDGLEGLDSAIQMAEQFGIKLILPLVNHWKDLGGMPMYLEWLGLEPSQVNQFYQSLDARLAYRNWVTQVLTRRNTRTGRLYCEEPAIMAWELTNEARCTGQRDVLLDWVGEMAGFVKQLDPNHLVALGDEGFFHENHFLDRARGQLYDGRHGTDFAAILKIPEIDFGGYHFYPQDWGHGSELDFADRWIRDHAKAGEQAKKPVLMEEYGLKVGDAVVPDIVTRNRWFSRWLDTISSTGTAGALLWMLGGSQAETRGFKDDYTICTCEELSGVLAPSSAQQIAG